MESFGKKLLDEYDGDDHYDHLPIPMAIFKFDHRQELSSSFLVSCNDFFVYMTGSTKDNLIGKKRDELGDFCKRLTDEQKKMLFSGERISINHLVYHQSGAKFCLKNYSKLHRNDEGVFIISCYFFDGSLSQNKPHPLECEHVNFPSMFFKGILGPEGSTLIINEISSEGHILLDGKIINECLGTHIYSVDLFQFENALRKIRNNERVSAELKVIFKNKKVTFCQIDFWKPIPNQNQILGVIHPIGDYDALLFRHLHLVRKTSDWIWVATIEGRIVFSNQSYEELFNMKGKQALGKSIFDIIPHFTKESFEKIGESCFPSTEIEVIHRKTNNRLDGPEFYSSITPFQHPITGKIVIGGVTKILKIENTRKMIVTNELTLTERSILEKYKTYHSAKTVADVLGMSAHTVNNHLKSLRLKLKIEKVFH